MARYFGEVATTLRLAAASVADLDRAREGKVGTRQRGGYLGLASTLLGRELQRRHFSCPSLSTLHHTIHVIRYIRRYNSRRNSSRRLCKVTLGVLRPDAVRIDVERKRIVDAIRMATYNAESAPARLLAPHYARAEDEARSLLREAFKTSADLEVLGTTLHVRIDPLSAPRRTHAIAGLCEALNATETIYPGTNLELVYSVKGG